MFSPDILIGTDTFSRTITRPTSSVYSDNNQPLTNPRTLQISHETAKSARVSTAVILDDTQTVTIGNTTSPDNVRVLLKVNYNPLGGRSNLTGVVKEAIAELLAFAQVESNITKLLNKES